MVGNQLKNGLGFDYWLFRVFLAWLITWLFDYNQLVVIESGTSLLINHGYLIIYREVEGVIMRE